MSNSNQAEEEQSRPKRRAAKNISSGSYLEEEYAESPMSEYEREDDEIDETKEKGIRRRIGRPRTSARNNNSAKKFPKIKLRMIRGSEENTPIFLAQSMDEVGFCGFVICC